MIKQIISWFLRSKPVGEPPKIPEETKEVAKVGTSEVSSQGIVPTAAIENTPPADPQTLTGKPSVNIVKEAAVPTDVVPVTTATVNKEQPAEDEARGEERAELPAKPRPKLPAKPTPRENNQDYGAAVLEGAITDLVGGVNLGIGTNAINYALEALQKQAKVLAQSEYDSTKPELVARSAAHTAKVIDETLRLTMFIKGGPDSRVETQATEIKQTVIQDILAGLTDEQFATFSKWMNEARERDANKQNKH